MTGLCSMMDVRGRVGARRQAGEGGAARCPVAQQLATTGPRLTANWSFRPRPAMGPRRSPSDAVELDCEMARTSQDRARPVLGRVRDESGLLQPARQLPQRDLRLGSGEGSAEA